MKVAIHVDGHLIRGNERQALLIAGGLRDRGHAVVVACRASGHVRDSFEAAGIRTTGVRPRGDADVVSALAFARWLRRERPDAALLTSWKRVWGASWAAHAARVPRTVLRVGGPQYVARGGPSSWKHRLAFGRYVDAVVANSQALGGLLREGIPGVHPERVHVVPNAVAAALTPPARLRDEIGADASDVLVLAVGGLERLKGFDLAIEAMARLDTPDVRLVVLGGGSCADELRQQARRAGIADRVHFLGERHDVPALLAAADLFVHPSRRDSMANAMLEAMGAGVPVIATDVPGAVDALAPREGRPAAGWVVPPDDLPALSATLAEVVAGVRSGASAVRARAAEARWRVDHWFTVESMARGYEAVLRGDRP